MEQVWIILATCIGFRILIFGFPSFKIGCTEVNHYYNEADPEEDTENDEEN